MLAGIQVTEIVVGTGALAERGKVVLVHFRGCRPQGEEVLSTYSQAVPQRVHLGKRNCIVGIERGIEGMRVGGWRRLEIVSELTGGCVNGDERLRVEVELFEVRDPGERRPEDYPPGKWVMIFRPGEAARGLCRWQFNLGENGAGGFVITRPLPDGTWRHARSKHVAVQWKPEVAKASIASVLAVREEFPAECLTNEDTWADTSEKANSISRDRNSKKLCLHFYVQERGETLCSYSLREDSPALLKSELYRLANQALQEHLPETRAVPPGR